MTKIVLGRRNYEMWSEYKALLKRQAIKSISTETLLKELKDRGVISSWYYNGTYHVGNELPKESE